MRCRRAPSYPVCFSSLERKGSALTDTRNPRRRATGTCQRRDSTERAFPVGRIFRLLDLFAAVHASRQHATAGREGRRADLHDSNIRHHRTSGLDLNSFVKRALDMYPCEYPRKFNICN